MTESTFRTVRKGYEPTDVDRHINELKAATVRAQHEHAQASVELDKLHRAYSQATADIARLQERLAEAEEAANNGVAPTFEHLGQRVAEILSLAETEANELRANATADAEAATAAAAEQSERALASAHAEAADAAARSDAEVARKLADAQRRADEILDVADREAAARREEAEALFEDQRARAAAAATDFETTLAQRRDQAAQEFERALASHQQQLADAQERLDHTTREADQVRAAAARDADLKLQAAAAEADQHIRGAQETAAKIRRESERELAASAQQREAINSQLANVRQMLSTIGGNASGSLAEAIFADVPAAPHERDSGIDEEQANHDHEHQHQHQQVQPEQIEEHPGQPEGAEVSVEAEEEHTTVEDEDAAPVGDQR